MNTMAHERPARSLLVLGRALHAPWNEGTRVIGRDTARALASRHQVRVVSATERPFLKQADSLLHVEHIGVGPGIKGDYAALPHLVRRVDALLDAQPAAIAHLVGLPLALAPALRQRGLRVVVHITMAQHAYQQRMDKWRALLAWKVFNPWIDAYACSSRPIYESLVSQGYPQHKLHIIPPPIDTQRFQPGDRVAARRWLDVDDADFVVAYMGTISPLRFPAREVVAAIQEARATIPRLRLEVIAPLGTHSYNVAWARDHVGQAISDGSLPARLRLRDLDEDEKVMLYNAADVLLLPFQAPVAVEPPLTLLEAMACQTCVIVYPHANRSAVVDAQNGLAVAGSAELAAALRRRAAQSAADQGQVGQMARADITRDHSFSAVLESLEHLWGHLEATRRPAHAATIR